MRMRPIMTYLCETRILNIAEQGWFWRFWERKVFRKIFGGKGTRGMDKMNN